MRMRSVMIVMAVSMASGTVGCRAHVNKVHWGGTCTLKVQRSFDDVSVGVVEEGGLSACVDSAPEGVVYVYGQDPTCRHGWLWFSAEDDTESLSAKVETDLSTNPLPCFSPG